MSLKQVAELVRSHFFRWGWLIPAFLPLTSVAGRGAFNIASAIYFLWALASVLLTSGKTSAIWQQRWFLAFYGLMLLIWGLSLTQSADPRNGGYQLLRYLQFSLTGFYAGSPAANALSASSPDACHGVGIPDTHSCAIPSASIFSAGCRIHSHTATSRRRPPVVAAISAACDSLSITSPLVVALRDRRLRRHRVVARARGAACHDGRAGGVLVSRAALAQATLAGSRCGRGGFRYRLRPAFLPRCLNISFDFATMDRFTNGRATIWWQALNSPPENHWLGVGFGNIASRVDVLRIADLAGIGEVTVRHLHNFILDAWFETGILGLSTFLAMLGVVLARVLRAWPGLGQDHRRIAAAALAGVVALLTAGLLSFSYTSKQFALYLYLLLAVLLALPQNAWAEGGLPRNHKDG